MAHAAERQSDADRLFAVAWDEALSLGEDDAIGLWELRLAVNGTFPNSPDEVVLIALQGAVRELAYRDCIRFVWWDPQDESEQSVNPGELGKLLQHPERWQPPADLVARQLRYFAGEKSGSGCVRKASTG